MKPRLTYANVVSTLALFLVLGGGVTYAAVKLGKNDVTSKHVKNNSLTGKDIKESKLKGVGATKAGRVVIQENQTKKLVTAGGVAYSFSCGGFDDMDILLDVKEEIYQSVYGFDYVNVNKEFFYGFNPADDTDRTVHLDTDTSAGSIAVISTGPTGKSKSRPARVEVSVGFNAVECTVGWNSIEF